MQIANGTVVSINYTLTDDGNNVIDSSAGAEPLAYIHGANNIIPGLEKALSGKATGDRLEVSVPPQEAYGLRDEALSQVIPRDRFESEQEIEVGMQFQTPTSDGVSVVTVTGVDNDTITVDANHPLAGVTLHFQVEVVAVRAATAEELEHGHIHGAGGHQH
ncbi:MAG: peptidylprolyl isomerase [Gammaproteobacteria bacterium]|nr:peptidylprolyl isomerase [Gammaproteobacteria bacterium]